MIELRSELLHLKQTFLERLPPGLRNPQLLSDCRNRCRTERLIIVPGPLPPAIDSIADLGVRGFGADFDLVHFSTSLN